MRIGFLYPCKDIGGAQLLFARLAKYISEIYLDVELFYIDYLEGYSANWLKKKKVRVVHLPYFENKRLELPADLVIILPFDLFSLKICLKNLTFSNTKFIFWFIEPNLLLAVFHATRITQYLNINITKFLLNYLFFHRYKKIKKLLWQSNDNKSLLFMDGENLKIPQTLFPFLKISPMMLPIPIDLVANFKKPFSEPNQVLNVAWLGRISKEKIGSILTVLEDLSYISNEYPKKIHFHVIGNGEAMPILKKACGNLTIGFTLHGILEGIHLFQLLCQKIDLMFAMGTSALEGASLSIPTVLLDLIPRRKKTPYLYKWIFETENFTLGQNNQTHLNQYSIHQILSMIETQEKWEHIANLSFNYAKNHDIKNIACQVVDICSNCNNRLDQNAFPR